MEKKTSIWSSQLAWIGVCHRTSVGQVACSRADRAVTAAVRAVVHHPEGPGGGAVGLLGRDLGHQAMEGGGAGSAFTPAEELGPVDVPPQAVRQAREARVANRVCCAGRSGRIAG